MSEVKPIVISGGKLKQASSSDAIPVSNVPIVYGSTSGTNTYTSTLSPAITAYETGRQYNINFATPNTTSSTLNLNSLGAKAVKNSDGTDVVAGTLTNIVPLVYNGTYFQIVGGSSTGSTANNDYSKNFLLGGM